MISLGLYVFAFLSQIFITYISSEMGFGGKGASRFTTFDAFPIYGVAVALFLVAVSVPENAIKSKRIQKLILAFSGSSFSVYLIHEHPSVRTWLWKSLNLGQYKDLGGLLIIILLVCVAIYVIDTVVDKLTWGNIKKLISKIPMEKLDKVFNEKKKEVC